MRPAGVFKIRNEYAGALYARTPKAVFAAVAVSALTGGGDSVGDPGVGERIVHEWRALHLAGIVPQAPPPHDEAACPVCSEVGR